MHASLTPVLCAALALSVGASAQREQTSPPKQQPKPQQPKPKQQPGKKPPSERELRLQKAVDEMVVVVEKYAQLKFEKPPKVRATRHKEWRELIRRQFGIENGRELFETSVSTLGLYLAESQEIVLSPLVVAPLIKKLDDDAPRHRRIAVMHQKATIAHEIVHALQEVHFGLPSKLEAAEEVAEILRYKWLIEGHAVLVEELIAEKELGIEDFMLTGPYGGLSVGLDPSYVRGRNYFVHILRTEGMKGVHQRLKKPPTFEVMKELAKKPLPPEPEPDDKNDQARPARPAGAGKKHP